MHTRLRIRRFVQLAIHLLLAGIVAAGADATPVDETVIRRVATNFVANHVNVHGDWNGVRDPAIAAIERVEYRGEPVAYSVTVNPSGHLLMAYDDDFSPVLLYSAESSLDPARADVPGSPESWIIPETYALYEALKARQQGRTPAQASADDAKWAASPSGRAWAFFDKAPESFTPQSRRPAGPEKAEAMPAAIVTASVVGPLLATSWNQSEPYHYYTPGIAGAGGCSHTPTGCVATATAQLMKYWNWPASGTSSHSYPWNGTVLSASFAHTYEWSSMPNVLTSSNSPAQIDAVARLMSDVGIADEMAYSCSSSGAYVESMVSVVLPTYFKYKVGVEHDRTSFTAQAFFSLVQADLDRTPGRPMLFTVWTPSRSAGHAVVIDGYKTGTTDMVHINLGWGGSYTGYYDISNNWSTGSYTWDATSQKLFAGIEPNQALVCFPQLSSTSRNVGAEAFNGTVSVTVASGCAWTATSNAAWIGITSGSPGTGSGTVAYAVAANTTASSRTGTLTIAGQTYTVNQGAASGSNLVVAAGFESGTSAWIQSSTGGFANIWQEPGIAHTGNYDAWLGGYDNAKDFLYQRVSIPANAQTATLEFWLNVATNESPGSGAWDFLYVNLYDTTTGQILRTIRTYSNEDSTVGWVKQSAQFDVSAYGGGTIYLAFVATTDSWLPTNFRIDDVALTATLATATRVIGLSGNLAFGSVPVGSTATATLTISNTGNSALTVSSISYPVGFSGSWAGGTVPAGGSQMVTVTFAPTAVTSYVGTITVSANQTSGTNTISVSGTASAASPHVFWRRSDGMDAVWQFGGPGAATVTPSFPPSVATDWEARSVADVTGDLIPDVIWFHPASGTVAIWVMAGPSAVASVTYPATLGGSSGWRLAGAGDLNGDGRADLVWRNTNTGQLIVWYMSAAGAISGTRDYGNVPRSYDVRGLGDVNGDGTPDIVWFAPNDGIVAIWMMHPDGTYTAAFPGAVGAGSWRPYKVADIDGDGKADLLWRNEANGMVAAWYMNAGAMVDFDFYVSVPIADWTLGTVSDFNLDSRADLLWYGPNSGAVLRWTMQGRHAQPVLDLLPSVGTGWSMVQ